MPLDPTFSPVEALEQQRRKMNDPAMNVDVNAALCHQHTCADIPPAGMTAFWAHAICDMANDNGFSVQAQYSAAFSDTYTSHGGSLRLSYKF